MTKTMTVASLAAVLGLGSIASADRGYGSRGGDRYAAQRYQASARYEAGPRSFDRAYSRGYGLRPSYDRDYNRRYDAGYRYYAGRPSYSGFSFGYGSGGYYRDSFSLNFGYSRGPTYYAPAPVYRYRDYCPPPVVYQPTYCAPGYYSSSSYYYGPTYGSGFYAGGGGYYWR